MLVERPLDWFSDVNYAGPPMAPAITDTPTALGREFSKRLKQLGMSRREFVRRSGLSRQTLFKIENEGHTVLRDQTYAALDTYLHWVPGTAVALATGNEEAIENADALTRIDRESAYRWRIVERIQSMSLEELEQMVALMESRTLGESPISTQRHIELMASRIDTLEEKLGVSSGGRETRAKNQPTGD